MTNLVLDQVIYTGQVVDQSHFGGNTIGAVNTVSGHPTTGYVDAVNELGLTTLRYPAGQSEQVCKIVNGSLSDHLTAYLNWARDSGHDVVIVLPTADAYPGPETITEFVKMLLTEYGDVIHAFEVGNEYWQNQGETEYGIVANEILLAIGEASKETGTTTKSWVQMGSTFGYSEFRETGEGWASRNIQANEAIISQLSAEARSVVDGVIEHYYFRPQEQIIGSLEESDNFIGRDYEVWQDVFVNELTLNITEWNINNGNTYSLGMRSASTILAQFSFMMSLGVDESFVWPPRHNTTNNLAGSWSENLVVDEGADVVINSIGGAIFDLMSSSLIGLEAVSTSFYGENSFINTYTFAGEDRVVVYVASRSNYMEDVSLELGNFFSGASITSALRVGYDQSTSDGQHWSSSDGLRVNSDFVIIGGERYYLNEHDVRATISQLDVSNSSGLDLFDFRLSPFEVVELTFELPRSETVEGTNGNDRIFVDDGIQVIQGLDGNDTIESGHDSDTIFGGNGDDRIISGAGSDVVFGGDGSDFISGWGGADNLSGGRGNDTLLGFESDDKLYGDDGNDTIRGGEGDDWLFGGKGDDTLSGQDGNDTLSGQEGINSLSGGDGRDVFIFETLDSDNVVSDFEVGIDEISFRGLFSNYEFVRFSVGEETYSVISCFGLEESQSLEIFCLQVESGVEISLANGKYGEPYFRLILDDIMLPDISLSDFLL